MILPLVGGGRRGSLINRLDPSLPSPTRGGILFTPLNNILPLAGSLDDTNRTQLLEHAFEDTGINGILCTAAEADGAILRHRRRQPAFASARQAACLPRLYVGAYPPCRECKMYLNLCIVVNEWVGDNPAPELCRVMEKKTRQLWLTRGEQ